MSLECYLKPWKNEAKQCRFSEFLIQLCKKKRSCLGFMQKYYCPELLRLGSLVQGLSWGLCRKFLEKYSPPADGLHLLLASVAGQGSTQHLYLPHGNLVCIPPRASHASHMSISLITGRLSPPFLRKKRRCFLLHIAAEPVNAALLQKL